MLVADHHCTIDSPLYDLVAEEPLSDSDSTQPEQPRPREQNSNASFTELTCAQLLTEQPPQAWLLPGMLQQHEPAVIVGPSKSMKTSLAVDLCGALASGGKFLGQFAADRAFRVGFVGGAAARGALHDLAQRWSAATQVDMLTLDKLAWSLGMDDLSNPANVRELEDWIVRHQLEVVLIDVADLTTNSRRAQAAQLRDLVRCCQKLGATPIICCPTRTELKPRQLDAADLASAACHAVARQWLLVNHRQTYEAGSGQHLLWLTLGGNMGQGGAWGVDIDEGRFDDADGRKWEVMLRDAASIARENVERAAKSQTDRLQQKLRTVMTYVDPLEATKLKIRQASRMSGDKFAATWDQLVAAGEIVRIPPLPGSDLLTSSRYELVQPPQKKKEASPVHSTNADSAPSTEPSPAPAIKKRAESSPLDSSQLKTESQKLLQEIEAALQTLDKAAPPAEHENKTPPSPVHSAKPPRKRRVKPRKRRR